MLIICLEILIVYNANHGQKLIDAKKQEYEKIIEELIKKFRSIYQFCDGDLNKFILLLRKGIYPCEYMDSWEKFTT